LTLKFYREVDQQKEFAISKFAKDILELFDNLTRALDNCPEAQRADNVLFDGIEMTKKVGNNI
jgi:molecular chaperone GrpE